VPRARAFSRSTLIGFCGILLEFEGAGVDLAARQAQRSGDDGGSVFDGVALEFLREAGVERGGAGRGRFARRRGDDDDDFAPRFAAVGVVRSEFVERGAADFFVQRSVRAPRRQDGEHRREIGERSGNAAWGFEDEGRDRFRSRMARRRSVVAREPARKKRSPAGQTPSTRRGGRGAGIGPGGLRRRLQAWRSRRSAGAGVADQGDCAALSKMTQDVTFGLIGVVLPVRVQRTRECVQREKL
jgi:hypothetical protein